MLDKKWVHLCRLDPAYEKGAWNFVQVVSAEKGESVMIICPCKDCRNVDRHSASDVVAHIITRGMDEVYKQCKEWFHHGDQVNSIAEGERKVNQWNEEIAGLYRAAEYLDEELDSTRDMEEMAEGDDMKEDEFLAKLADAETPLYPTCSERSLRSLTSVQTAMLQGGR